MAATTGHSINTGPYGENTEICSSLKLLLNQRLSRACIIHLVIKKTNWSYVKTMSCSGSHLGIPINIKNTKFVKVLPMNVKKIFSSETAWPNGAKLGIDGPWVCPFQNCVRQPHPPFKMAAVFKGNDYLPLKFAF
jgi:hypothetical protein